MPKQSAGLLMYRFRDKNLEFFLVHPGGPYWMKKDDGAWSIPKGEYSENEDALTVAKREFLEETGFTAEGEFRRLTPIKQKGGKWVYAWAFEGDCDPSSIKSNTFTVEWPPRSGKQREFPEVDRAAWFLEDDALVKINSAQSSFIREVKASN